MLPMLKNPVASRVVLALLHDPARDWSLEAMAETGITSRATLVRTFRNICGKPPMAFLQDIRLALARQQLIGTNESIAKIASRIGYQSEGPSVAHSIATMAFVPVRCAIRTEKCVWAICRCKLKFGTSKY